MRLAGLEVTIFTQIGFVVLVGLASKNAIRATFSAPSAGYHLAIPGAAFGPIIRLTPLQRVL